MKPNLNAIRQHLDAWAAPFSQSEFEDGLCEIAYTAPGTPAPDRARMFGLDELDAAAYFAAEQNAKGANLYIGAAMRTPDAHRYKRGSTLDFYAAAFAACEADEAAETVAERIKGAGFKGAIRVKTGSKPELRVHHWLPLRELCDDPDEYTAALGALVAHVGADHKVRDSARILRLGGTVNWISDPAKQAKGYVDELTMIIVEETPKADLGRLASLPPTPGWQPKTGKGGTGGNGGPGEIIRNADGLVTDGREAFWRHIVMAELAKYQRAHGADPTGDEIFDAAFPRFCRETVGDDRWTAPSGQTALRKRAHNTIRRLRNGHLARFGLYSIETQTNKSEAEKMQAERDRNRADGVAPRSYDELMEAAQALEPGKIDDMEAIVNEATELNPMRRDAIFRAIKDAAKVPLGTLRDQSSYGSETDDLDHLDLARITLNGIGRENLICADAFVWQWSDAGVWAQQDDRAIKQVTQNVIDTECVDVTASLVNGVTDVLKSEIFKSGHEFNRGNPEAVNCLNGEIELQGGCWVLRPHCREHYRTTQIPVAYDQSADAPLFRTFLDQVFQDDADKADKIKSTLELMGYTLMSHARHERFVMLIGPGANGKSILLSVLERLLGLENVAGVQPSNFENRFQRAHLHQKLANIVTELKQGEVIADAELKAISSGEPATVEHKFQNPFVMRPFATCWFGTNHMPHTRDFSEALFRRATILQFNRTFAPHEQDPRLKTDAFWNGELPGILNMTLAAYAKALAEGFTQPQSSEAAKKEWRLEADQVAQFVDDTCQRSLGARTPVGDVFRAYQSWAQDNGIGKTMSQKGLRDRLTRLGFGADRSPTVRYVTGLKVTTLAWGS